MSGRCKTRSSTATSRQRRGQGSKSRSRQSDGDEFNRRQTQAGESREDDREPVTSPAAWELGAASLVPALPVAAFVIAGDSAVGNAGPAAILSVLLALAASGLTAYCKSQLPSRHRRYLFSSVGGLYELAYRMCGEALAFVVGWLVVLHRISSVSAVASSIGLYADNLLSTTRQKLTVTTVWNDDTSSGAFIETVFATNDSFRIRDNDSSLVPVCGRTFANLTDGGGAAIGGTGHISPIAVIASVIVAIIATAATVEGLHGVIARQVSHRSTSRLMTRTMTSSWPTGAAVAVDVLVIGLLVFASAVSVFHGLHFDNWNGTGRFFVGGARGLLVGAGSFYFVFDIYNGVARRMKLSSSTNCQELQDGIASHSRVHRRQPASNSAAATATSNTETLVFSTTLAIIAATTLCIVALTTLTPPSLPVSFTSGCNETIAHPSLIVSESYAAADLTWMKRIVCAVAMTTLIPAAILWTRDTWAVIRFMAADGLLPEIWIENASSDDESGLIAVKRWSAIGVACLSSFAVISTTSIFCSPDTLVGLASVTSLVISSVTVFTVLDALYRPLETLPRRQRRRIPKSINGDRWSSSWQPLNSSTNTVDVVLTASASSSSIMYGTSSTSPSRRVIDCIDDPITESQPYHDLPSSSGTITRSDPPSMTSASITSAAGGHQSTNVANGSDIDGSDSSSCISSTDTDIDAAVDEYQLSRLTTLVHCRQDDALIDVRCPDIKSHSRAVSSIVTYATSVSVLSILSAHTQAWASTPSATVGIILGVVLTIAVTLSAVGIMCVLPRNDDVLTFTTSTFRSRGMADGDTSTVRVRGAALVSMGVNCFLMPFVNAATYAVGVTWIFTGLLIYVFYGFRHSIENTTTSATNHRRNDDVNPEEQRILILIGGEGHGAASTTSTSVGLQHQRPRDTLSRDELTLALSV